MLKTLISFATNGFLDRLAGLDIWEWSCGSFLLRLERERRRRNRNLVSDETVLADVADDAMEECEEADAAESADSDEACDDERDSCAGL